MLVIAVRGTHDPAFPRPMPPILPRERTLVKAILGELRRHR